MSLETQDFSLKTEPINLAGDRANPDTELLNLEALIVSRKTQSRSLWTERVILKTACVHLETERVP